MREESIKDKLPLEVQKDIEEFYFVEPEEDEPRLSWENFFDYYEIRYDGISDKYTAHKRTVLSNPVDYLIKKSLEVVTIYHNYHGESWLGIIERSLDGKRQYELYLELESKIDVEVSKIKLYLDDYKFARSRITYINDVAELKGRQQTQDCIERNEVTIKKYQHLKEFMQDRIARYKAKYENANLSPQTTPEADSPKEYRYFEEVKKGKYVTKHIKAKTFAYAAWTAGGKAGTTIFTTLERKGIFSNDTRLNFNSLRTYAKDKDFGKESLEIGDKTTEELLAILEREEVEI